MYSKDQFIVDGPLTDSTIEAYPRSNSNERKQRFKNLCSCFRKQETIDDAIAFPTRNHPNSMSMTRYHSACDPMDIPIRTQDRVPGYVVVIINHEFPSLHLPRGKNIEKIHRLFSRKNYEVRSFTNLNKKEILEIINYYSSKSESGSLICFLSSEGDQTSLACPVKNVTDESSVKILDVLKSANTKELEMRRKIFFIDACRVQTNNKLKGKDIPEPPGPGYYVGFSSLNLTTCSVLEKDSLGIYFESLIGAFTYEFYRPLNEACTLPDFNEVVESVHHHIDQRKNKHGKCLQNSIVKSTLGGNVYMQEF